MATRHRNAVPGNLLVVVTGIGVVVSVPPVVVPVPIVAVPAIGAPVSVAPVPDTVVPVPGAAIVTVVIAAPGATADTVDDKRKTNRNQISQMSSGLIYTHSVCP